MNGECVPINSEKLQPLDGGWSQWSAFSRCSRTCGGGVRKRVRTCDNPRQVTSKRNLLVLMMLRFHWSFISSIQNRPRNGGKYCEGERVEYESCETQSCLNDQDKDFRDIQCELAALKALEKNSHKLSGFEGVTSKSWKAYYSQGTLRRH